MRNPDKQYEEQSRKRVRIFYYLWALLSIILIIGLGWRQLVWHKEYQHQMERQSLRRVVYAAPRGEILDREGRLLVGNRAVFNAAIYLNELRSEFQDEYYKRVREARALGQKVDRDKLQLEARAHVVQEYLKTLEPLLGRKITLNAKKISDHFKRRLLLPFIIADDLSLHEYSLLTEKLPVHSPIQVLVDSARFYPYGAACAHVLGYVGVAEVPLVAGFPGEHLKTFRALGKTGKCGLEKFYDEALSGQSGGEIWLVDPAGFQYQSLQKIVPKTGNTLHCSIDIDLQQVGERALKGHRGALVAIEIKTGEVLAMVSNPGYDLNDFTPSIAQSTFNAITEQSAWLNRATQGFYPPASPYKIITALAGLRYKVFDPDALFECDAGFKLGNRVFREASRRALGQADMKRAFKTSSNVYFIPIALKLGPEKLAAEARRFGLHEPTGIDLAFESHRMIVPDPQWKQSTIGESWLGGDTANMSIGQGYSLASPLQMACFAAAFARKETRIQPRLIHDSENTGFHPKSQPLLIKDEAYNAILDGLRECAEVGTAKHAQVPGMTLAAKTGTGQARLRGEDVVTACFFGFAPVEDPQIALAVLIEGDDKSSWGGTTAGPVAREVLQAFYKKYIAK